MIKGNLIVVSGPSGVGKDSICNELVKRYGMHLSVSMTTRGKRDYEKDGIDYYFTSIDEFKRNIDEIILLSML